MREKAEIDSKVEQQLNSIQKYIIKKFFEEKLEQLKVCLKEIYPEKFGVEYNTYFNLNPYDIPFSVELQFGKYNGEKMPPDIKKKLILIMQINPYEAEFKTEWYKCSIIEPNKYVKPLGKYKSKLVVDEMYITDYNQLSEFFNE